MICDTQCSNILAEDRACVNLSADELALRRNCRLAVILGAINAAIDHCCCLDEIRLCPKLQELWIRMIEEDDPAEDVWLWADGDEEWLQNSGLATAFFKNWYYYSIRKGEWVDAQSALRRRINWPKYLHTKAGNPASERIRNATPKQRFAAIYWLVFNSNRTRELAVELGCTPEGVLNLFYTASRISHVISNSWDEFPQDSVPWEVATTELQADGCTCLLQEGSGQHLRSWFNMLSWLDGKPPIMEDIGLIGCMRCRSLSLMLQSKSLF